MNELYQQDVLKESHCYFQEIDLFSSFFGGISADPLRRMKNVHQLFPAAVFQQEMIREAVTERQAYRIFGGKHNVGKNVKMSDGAIPLPNPNSQSLWFVECHLVQESFCATCFQWCYCEFCRNCP